MPIFISSDDELKRAIKAIESNPLPKLKEITYERRAPGAEWQKVS